VIDAATADLVERAIGKRPGRSVPLPGGCVADVRRLQFTEGDDLVAKFAPTGGLEIEGWMLRRLAGESSLPVPAVVHVEDRLLLLEYVDADGAPIGPAVERHAAELLASLHEISSDSFGFDRDTVIGTLDQPNPPAREWIPFFRDHRLLEMARRAAGSGALPTEAMPRIEHLAERLDEWIVEPARPSLIHGDVWSGNVLVRGHEVAAFIDPAIYYADPEIELAFTTLFSTFGASFFDRYSEIRPVSPEFFEFRRDLYNVYPLLVHTVLFGGHYGSAVDRTVRRFVG
jgi:fructosamine-3-kinase